MRASNHGEMESALAESRHAKTAKVGSATLAGSRDAKTARRVVGVLLLVGAVSVGCSGGGDCLPEAPPNAGAERIVFGRIESGDFVPLRAKERIPLEYGAQGGQHFFLALAVRNEGTFVKANVTVSQPGGVISGRGYESTASCTDGWTEIQEIRVVIEHTGASELSAVVDDADDMLVKFDSFEGSLDVIIGQ